MALGGKIPSPLLWLMLVFYTDVSLTFKITGATGGIDPETGARPFRHEISDFQSHGPAFDLYILSLSSFQSASQSDPLSYFQIAGMFMLYWPDTTYCMVSSDVIARYSWVSSWTLGWS